MNKIVHRHWFVVAVALVLIALPAAANHSWGSYHWGRTGNPFPMKIGDNVSTAWDTALQNASADWGQSTVLNTTIVAGQANPRNCRPTSGRIEVCNSTYGNNGWLGLAQIWASGTHITQGVTKLNDTYFNTSTYNTPAWRALVTCQEIGHDFGLDHQDENFNNANLNTCMDYTNNPSTNQHPNQHDYDQLQTIYSHLDSVNTWSSLFTNLAEEALRVRTIDELIFNAGQWGQPIKYDKSGRPNVFVLQTGTDEEGNAERVFTYVFWAPLADGQPGAPGRGNVE